jgi:hypothetical protein
MREIRPKPTVAIIVSEYPIRIEFFLPILWRLEPTIGATIR